MLISRWTRFGLMALALAALSGAALPLRADSADEIALQRALDSTIEILDLSDVPLPKAFEELATKGKIKLQVDPTSYDLLPFGETTKVNATLRQSRLGDAIDEMLKPLALEKTISGDKVLITPTAPLLRIGRRATWNELNVLWSARRESLPGLGGGNLLASLRTVLSNDRLQLDSANKNEQQNNAALEQVRKQCPMPAWKALDIYAQATEQIWFISDNTIQMMPQKQWISRQLDRRIAISKLNRPLVECVSELSHLSGIHFTPEPGLYSLFPQVTLNSTGGTVRDILDTLRGVIGIDYEIKDDFIALRKVSTQPVPAAGARPDPILGQIAVPISGGGEVLMFIRESQVPPEVADMLKKRVAESIDRLKRTPGGAPASAPAAAPATTAANTPTTQKADK